MSVFVCTDCMAEVQAQKGASTFLQFVISYVRCNCEPSHCCAKLFLLSAWCKDFRSWSIIPQTNLHFDFQPHSATSLRTCFWFRGVAIGPTHNILASSPCAWPPIVSLAKRSTFITCLHHSHTWATSSRLGKIAIAKGKLITCWPSHWELHHGREVNT
jgi:hypothetical protein